MFNLFITGYIWRDLNVVGKRELLTTLPYPLFEKSKQGQSDQDS